MTEDLQLTSKTTAATATAAGPGCACCAPSTDTATAKSAVVDAPATSGPTEPVTQRYDIAGMTCGHCVAAVIQELRGLDGVRDVHIDLVAGGTSTASVTSTSALSAADVAGAVDEAGYELLTPAS